jgi:choline kinase
MNNAVILAAGCGNRLLPLTSDKPKCLVEVNGETILERQLKCLASVGCKNVVIVIGYCEKKIREKVGFKYEEMNIVYINNSNYKKTNSMFSLYLGLTAVNYGTWILEGDVFIDKNVLTKARIENQSNIIWFVDSSLRNIDGCYLTSTKIDTSNIITSIDIIRDIKLLKPNQSKSVGILKVNSNGLYFLKIWLERGVAYNRHNDYYDLIIKDNVSNIAIEAVDICGCKWMEIDTVEDLKKTEELFSNEK